MERANFILNPFSLKGRDQARRAPRLQSGLDPAPRTGQHRSHLPAPTVFLDQAHVSNPCARPQFAAGACPPSSVLGKARVFTPLLDAPLEGPIYFRSNGGKRTPDVVADLGGQVHFVFGQLRRRRPQEGSEQPRIRTTFANVRTPRLQGGLRIEKRQEERPLRQLGQHLQAQNQAIVKMRGQNGKAHDSKPKVGTSCKKYRGAEWRPAGIRAPWLAFGMSWGTTSRPVNRPIGGRADGCRAPVRGPYCSSCNWWRPAALSQRTCRYGRRSSRSPGLPPCRCWSS